MGRKNVVDSFDSFQRSIEKCIDESDKMVFMLEKKFNVAQPANGEKINGVKQVEKAKSPIKIAPFETKVDKIIGLIEKLKSLSIDDLVKNLKISEECAYRWCQMLERRGLIEMKYSVFGKLVLIMAENGHHAQHTSENDRVLVRSLAPINANNLP